MDEQDLKGLRILMDDQKVRRAILVSLDPIVRRLRGNVIVYPYCSLGWLKEMFEPVLGKSVKAELLESTKRGGEKCRFVVHGPR